MSIRLLEKKSTYTIDYPTAIEFAKQQAEVFWLPDEIEVEKSANEIYALKKESEFNEHVRTVFLNDEGHRIEVTQISGALARTIVPWQGIGDQLRRGQRFGMIRLG